MLCDCGHLLEEHHLDGTGNQPCHCPCENFHWSVLTLDICGHTKGSCDCSRRERDHEPWTASADRSPRGIKRRKLPFRKVWDRDGWKCVECGAHDNLTVDHIIPLSKGGTDDLANLQTMCGSCNSRKGDRV